MKCRFVIKCKVVIIWEVKIEEYVEWVIVRLVININIDNIFLVKLVFLWYNIKICLVKWIYSRLVGLRIIFFI